MRLIDDDGDGAWLVSEKMARDYLASFEGEIAIKAHQLLNRFYQWAKVERYTLTNPFENIETGRLRPSLKVCSPGQIDNVEKYIKSPRSDPESAMILALTFYFGVRTKELAYATAEFEDQELKIIFFRGKLTYGNSRYRRDQVLILPHEPQWLARLTKNFKIAWLERFKNARIDIPRQPLIMHRRGQHNRPLTTLAVRHIYYKAVVTATGIRIPPNVLRRAGADLFVKQSGSGCLSRMGWSKAYAFNFTWMPREFFRP